VSLRHGARLVLINADQGKEPVGLADLIAGRGITVWYSTPSILTLLLQYGKLGRHTFPTLRYVLFAGEVFPIRHLRELTESVSGPRYCNLYGPTETNVCTFYEIPSSIPSDRTEPYPIGHACESFTMRVVGADGNDVPAGQEGELWASGPGVMAGYWNREDMTSSVMVKGDDGRRWYRTGDIVVETADDGYTFRGRRDRMVKRRGYRIELGEVETALYNHPALAEVAAVAVPDERSGVRIMVFLCTETGPAPTILEMKRFSAGVLPMYMVPDRFVVCESLPKTSTDKVDYQRLMEMA
jgi:acyl-coenzyme A synthetase/AMP-(fatty) acid ligase